MMRVKNRGCIHNLAVKNYRGEQKRNRIAVCAVILTTMLFTIVFTLAVGLKESVETNAMRMSGSRAHASIKYLSAEQFETLKNHPLIKKSGQRRVAGFVNAGSIEGVKRNLELDYCDENELELSFLELTDGRMPERADEIVMDDVYLEAMGYKAVPGQVISLPVDLSGGSVSEGQTENMTFHVTGIYHGDEAFSMASVGLVSEEFLTEYLKGRGERFWEDMDMMGSFSLSIVFDNNRNIEQKLRQVITDKGYEPAEDSYKSEENEVRYGVNWAYLSGLDNSGSLLPVCAGILLTAIAGYLIIFNIFQISVLKDIHFYGLLKTIGTTGRQIVKILVWQALVMCLWGVPAGLLIGFLTGKALLPVATFMLTGGGGAVSASPVIFAASAVFSVLTVLISCFKPARIAARISPVETVKYNGLEPGYKKKRRKSENGAKLTRMAFSNLGRNKKRTAVTVLSLTLSLVLLNTVMTVINGMDMDRFVKRFIDVDFQIAHSSYFGAGYRGNMDQEVTDSIIGTVQSADGFQDGGSIYTPADDCLLAADYDGEIPEDNPLSSALLADVYAPEEYPLSVLDIVEGSFDREKWETGDYVLLGIRADDYGNLYWENRLFDVGDEITLHRVESTGEDKETVYGSSKTYEIMGYYRITYTNSKNIYYRPDLKIMLPATELDRYGKKTRMTYLFAGENDKLEKLLAAYTQREEASMGYVSRETYKDNFNQMRFMILSIGGIACFFLGLIGVLNFINSISAGILSRRKEFAVLQAVGMTGTQLTGMLVLEGLYYALLTAAAAFFLSALVSFGLLNGLNEMVWILSFRPTFLPLAVTLPFLFCLAVLVPIYHRKSGRKNSLAEQLKLSED